MGWFWKVVFSNKNSDEFSRIHGFRLRIRLASYCYLISLLIWVFILFSKITQHIQFQYLLESLWMIPFLFGIMVLIFFERRFGIYLGFFYSFYNIWQIFSETIQFKEINLLKMLLGTLSILICALLIPVVTRDKKYSAPENISDDPQTILLELFFLFMILGVIGFCILLLKR